MSNLKNILNSFKIKNNLCPEVWDTTKEGYVLKKNIREKLLQIAYEFFDSLGVDVIISDITFTGSLANYNWSNFSDIDLHLIADFKQFDEEDLELFKELFLLKKTIFNDKHDITILGYEVELYVQDENEEHTSTGVYSVLNNEWIVEPKKEIEKIDANFIKKKSENWMKEIDSVIELSKEESLEDAKKLIKKFKEKIKKYRSCGLEKGGEYSIENLVFKVLRRNGYIEKLFDTSNKLVDDKLSIKEEEEVKDPDLTTSEKSDIIDPDIEKFYDSLEKIDSNVYQQERGSYTYQKDVESIQIALDLLGYPLPRFGVDGKFGPETAKAVNDFKKDNNIDDTPVKTESFNNETYFKNLIKESLNIQKKLIAESVYKSPAKNGTFKIRHPFKEVRKTKNLKKYPEGFRYHWGVDVEAAQESELIAIEDGVVVTATDGAGGCGGMLEICLTSGVRVKFCHMHKMYVSKGDKVVKDQVVGLVGGDKSDPKSKRGNTSSAHIHMEMFDSCTSRNHIDPYDYIKGAVYVGDALKQKGNVEQKPGEEIKSAEEQGFFSKIFGSLFGGKDEKTKEGMSFVSPEMADKLIEKLKEKEIKTGDIQKYTNVKNKKYPVELITGDVKIKGNFSGEALKNIQLMIDKLNEIGITNPYAQVGVLSVIGKESNFIPKNEGCHEGSKNPYLRSIFKERLDDYNDTELTELKKNCEEFFDVVYGKDANIGWNTGNTEKGDGFKYRGRGFNQLTFKHNYEKFGNIIGKDLVGNPDLVNDTEIAAEVAVQFFTVNAKGKIPNFDNKEDAIEYFANINAGGGKSSNLASALESGKRFDVVV